MLATEVPSLANGLISADGLTYTFPIRVFRLKKPFAPFLTIVAAWTMF